MTPNSPRDAALSSPLEVISEDEAATQSVATDGSADNSDSRKFKMRPPKMSSFTADAPKAAEFQVPLAHSFRTQTNLGFSQCTMVQLKDKEIWFMVV